MNTRLVSQWAECPPSTAAAEAALQAGLGPTHWGSLPKNELAYARKGASYEEHVAATTENLDVLGRMSRSKRVGTLTATAKNPNLTGEILLTSLQNIALRSKKYPHLARQMICDAPDEAIADALLDFPKKDPEDTPHPGLVAAVWDEILQETIDGRDNILGFATEKGVDLDDTVRDVRWVDVADAPDPEVLLRLQGRIPDPLLALLFGVLLVHQAPGRLMSPEAFEAGLQASVGAGRLSGTIGGWSPNFTAVELPEWQIRRLLDSGLAGAVSTVTTYGDVTAELYEEYEEDLVTNADRVAAHFPAPAADEILNHPDPALKLQSMHNLPNMGPIEWTAEECREVLEMPGFELVYRPRSPHPVETRYVTARLGDNVEAWKLLFALSKDWKDGLFALVDTALALSGGK